MTGFESGKRTEGARKARGKYRTARKQGVVGRKRLGINKKPEDVHSEGKLIDYLGK